MFSIPNTSTIRTRSTRTTVKCKCGNPLFQLNERESVVCSKHINDEIIFRNGDCGKCGEKYMIPIHRTL